MRRTQLVHKISARGIYTSGKGSSSVGLTAYVTKDPETKELVLERCGNGIFRQCMLSLFLLIDVESRAQRWL
jgi:DNA replication licensing factor MCM4